VQARAWSLFCGVLDALGLALPDRERYVAMKQRAKIMIVSFVLAALCLSSFFAFVHAVPADKLSRVSVGMTEAQVESIIGAPRHLRHESAGGTVFCYGGFPKLRWCSVEIHFGGDGKVAGSVFHDH
jgi:hypothetical protein